MNSNKEIIDSTVIGVAAGTVTTTNLVVTVNDYTGTVGQIPIGSTVKGIYLFHQIQPQAAQAQVDWNIGKTPGNQVALPQPGNVGGSNARKWILHEEKGIPGIFNNGASPLTFRGFIKMPRGKGMPRFGEDDRVQLKSSAATVYDMCLKAIYKRFQ